MALTPRQIEELSTLIEERRRALIDDLQEEVARTRADRFEDLAGGSGRDPGDESVATLIADLDHADVGRDIEELRALEAARLRIQNGSYGTCVDCGNDIEFARLRVNPAAARDIECQQRYEKTHAVPARTTL